MPIDLVIDERETGPSGTKAEGLPGDSNNNANRSNADSASHTDGASTPEVVSQISRVFFLSIPMFLNYGPVNILSCLWRKNNIGATEQICSVRQANTSTNPGTNKQTIGAALPNNDILSLLFSLIFPFHTLHSVRFSN